jgi:hypothetical protein
VPVDKAQPLVEDHRARKQITLLIAVVAEGKENDKGGVAKDRSELKPKRTVAQVNEQEQTAGAQSRSSREKRTKRRTENGVLA